MLRLSSLLIVLFVSAQMHAQGIEFFHGKWKEALELATKEDKLVFVDAYAKWCGPCKKMAKNVFTQAEVGDFYNKNFINVKLDMEESDGRTFGAKYPVSAYPTLLFLNGKGELVKKVTGGQQASGLITIGEAAMKGYDRSGEFAKLYEEGKRDYTLMVNYVRELNKVEKPSLKITNEYLNSNPDITEDQKALFLLEAVTEADSKIFDQLIDLKNSAIKQTSKEKFEEVVHTASINTVHKAVEYDYVELVDEAVSQYNKADLGGKDKFQLEAYAEYYQLSGDYAAWKENSKKLLKKFGKKQPHLYKDQISTLGKSFKHEKDATEYSAELYKDLIKKDDSLENYMAYIQLLTYKKDKAQAIKVTNEAIKKAKSKGEDTMKFDRTLDYLNSI